MFEKVIDIIQANSDDLNYLSSMVAEGDAGFFDGANFEGVDLSQLDLTFFSLKGAIFQGAKLSNSTKIGGESEISINDLSNLQSDRLKAMVFPLLNMLAPFSAYFRQLGDTLRGFEESAWSLACRTGVFDVLATDPPTYRKKPSFPQLVFDIYMNLDQVRKVLVRRRIISEGYQVNDVIDLISSLRTINYFSFLLIKKLEEEYGLTATELDIDIDIISAENKYSVSFQHINVSVQKYVRNGSIDVFDDYGLMMQAIVMLQNASKLSILELTNCLRGLPITVVHSILEYDETEMY